MIEIGDDLNDSSSENNVIQLKTSVASFSPNTQIWKVDTLSTKEQTEFELHTQGPFWSPGKWNISSVHNKINDPERSKNATKDLVVNGTSKMVNNGEYPIYTAIQP